MSPNTTIKPCPSAGRGRLGATTGPALETGRNRLLIAATLATLAFAVVGWRLIDIAVTGARATTASTALGTEPETARTDILDRNGVLLATSLKTYSLFADPARILDPARATRRLAQSLPGLDPVELLADLSSDRRFVWIRRGLTPAERNRIHRLGIPGIDFRVEERRVYPQGRLAAHAVGLVDIDGKGIAGVEQALDGALTAPGAAPLRLSLDLRVQHVVREALQDAIETFSAVGGTGIVLDVTTGEVAAMVSLPDFDPNSAAIPSDDERFNRATLGTYEMGSTFKIFTSAMALDSGRATLADGYDATRPIQVARFTISDYHAKARWLTVPEIFMYSSNIGSVRMALDVGTEGQQAYLRALGLLDAPHIELPEVGRPLIPDPWRRINTMTIAFGHGLSVSPLQLAGGVSAVVNGGIRTDPTLVTRDAPATGQRVLRPETSAAMRRLMRLVVERGTGRNANAEGYMVGGKTGTAEKSGTHGYRRKSLLSSFVAAFPMHAPRYVVLAIIDEPQGTKETHGYATGGWVAAPVVREIIARAAPFLGVAPINEEKPEIVQALDIDGLLPGAKRLASFRAN